MNTHLIDCFVWLLRVSWQASVLAVIVLAVQWVFQKQLSARWRYALWFLLIARLVLPVLPSSPVSIFNLGSSRHAPTGAPAAVESTYSTAALIPAQAPLSEEQRASSPLSATRPVAQPIRLKPTLLKSSAESSLFPRWNVWQFMALVWLAGLALFTVRIVVQNVRFLRRLAAAAPVSDPQVLSLVDACRTQIKVTSKIRLVESASVKSPALHGLLRKTLLLPPGMIQRFSEEELRHIFLHEMAHIKRKDMAVLALVTLCKIVHWFNPVLWLAFQRMSADRELACDELVLSCAGERQSGAYGQTILKLLEVCARPTMAPGLIGILEEKEQVRRRILMIAGFGQRRRSSLPAIVLAAVIGLVTLTNAQTDQPGPASAINNATLVKSTLDFDKAQLEYQRAIGVYQLDRQRAAAAIFHLGEAYRQQNQNDKANEQFQRIVNEFADVPGIFAKSEQYLLSLPDAPPDFLFSIDNVLYPGGVAADSAGNIYVSDTHRNRIDKYSREGNPITQWGQPGNEKGNFNYPQGLAIDSADNVYVADVDNNRVQKFAADGTFLKAWGELGSDAGEFNRPYNIAVDKDGNVYVVDSDNNRIQEFTSEGAYLRAFGRLGVGAGKLHGPQGVAVDSNGNIYVGNRPNQRVEKFSPDGTAQTGFNWAGVHDVAVDAAGNIYLANADQSCVQEFTPGGVLLTQWGREGTAPGQFNFLARIAVDKSRGRILITDAQNNRVQVFGYTNAAASK